MQVVGEIEEGFRRSVRDIDAKVLLDRVAGQLGVTQSFGLPRHLLLLGGHDDVSEIARLAGLS